MADALTLLDQALEVGRKELGFLLDGDVAEASRLARDRGQLTAEAMAGGGGVNLDQALEKLTQLQGLQGQITQEARRLHAALKKDLLRARQENKRFTAYKEGSVKGHRLANRFISRQG
jgi:uncharacterized protein involved in exopolysaccharide biosynthesis